MDNTLTQVYFDWNIIAYFRDYIYKKNNHYSQEFERIKQIISEGKIISYYSDAHLIDLIPISQNRPDIEFYLKDIEAISIITSNRYLQFDYFNTSWKFIQLDPKKQMIHLLKTHFDTFDFESQFNEMDFLGTLLKKTLKNIPSPIPDSVQYKPDNNFSLFNVMEFLTSENNKSMKDPKLFKNRKKFFYDGLIKEDNMLEIKSSLDRGDISKFNQFYNKTVNLVGNIIKSRFDEMQFMFSLLDQFYFASDKKMRNIGIDSKHATFASHSWTKYLVTQDKNLRKKADIAYHILDISVKILNLKEFIDQIDDDI